jgi:biopolymer transport protein ExbD
MNWLDSSFKGRKTFSLGRASTSPEPEINLIPFIDVLLVVLIFLMISTTFTRYQELAITLPSANGNESQAESKQIHIAVSRDGRFAINGKVTDASQLSNALTQLSTNGNANSQVNIDADAKAPHQSVMTALEAARDANLSNIVFSSQTKK